MSSFLARNYIYAERAICYRNSARSVRLSVRPSHGWISQLTLSVCLSQKNFKLLLLFVSRWNLAILGRQFSMTPSTKRCSSIFDLGPITPKIYSPKFAQIAHNSACTCMTDRPEMFEPTRGFSGMDDSTEPCKMLWGQPLLLWQRNLG